MAKWPSGIAGRSRGRVASPAGRVAAWHRRPAAPEATHFSEIRLDVVLRKSHRMCDPGPIWDRCLRRPKPSLFGTADPSSGRFQTSEAAELRQLGLRRRLGARARRDLPYHHPDAYLGKARGSVPSSRLRLRQAHPRPSARPSAQPRSAWPVALRRPGSISGGGVRFRRRKSLSAGWPVALRRPGSISGGGVRFRRRKSLSAEWPVAFRRPGSISGGRVRFRRQTSISDGWPVAFRRPGSISDGRVRFRRQTSISDGWPVAFRRPRSLSCRPVRFRRQKSVSDGWPVAFRRPRSISAGRVRFRRQKSVSDGWPVAFRRPGSISCRPVRFRRQKSVSDGWPVAFRRPSRYRTAESVSDVRRRHRSCAAGPAAPCGPLPGSPAAGPARQPARARHAPPRLRPGLSTPRRQVRSCRGREAGGPGASAAPHLPRRIVPPSLAPRPACP